MIRNKLLLLVLSVLLSAHLAHAGRWYYISGNDASTQGPGTYTLTTTNLTFSTNNTLTLILTGNLLAQVSPPLGTGGSAQTWLRVQTNSVTLSIPQAQNQFQHNSTSMSYLGSTASLTSQGQISVNSGTLPITLQKFIPNLTYNSGSCNDYSLMVYADNEYGPSDDRILAALAGVVTNLQGQITTVSNQLATVQGQVTTNTAAIAALQTQYGTLTNQYNTLSNQLANIPTASITYGANTSGLATQAQINDLQNQINALDSKYNKRTDGVLGGNMWNDVATFSGLGIGLGSAAMGGVNSSQIGGINEALRAFGAEEGTGVGSGSSTGGTSRPGFDEF